ncbi:MAG: trigger factor [Myxococcota bacterium]
MAYEVEETGAHTRVAQVTVPAGDVNREVNKELKKLSKRVRVQGFRKGKVPLPVMRRQYGGQVLQDVLQDTVNAQINALLEDAPSVLYLGEPEIESMPPVGDLRFKVEYEVRPSLDPIGYLGVEVERPKVEVSSEDVDEQLEAMRNELATLEPIAFRTEIAAGDVVEMDFEALGDDEALEQMRGEDISVEVGAGQTLLGIDEALVGAAFGATVVATVTLDENFPAEELRGRDVELQLKVKSVKKKVLPELDDEFAVDTGEAQTLFELRTKIKEQIEEAMGHQATLLAQDNLMDTLVEQNDFELPPKFLDQQVQGALQQELQQLLQSGNPAALQGLDLPTLQEHARERRERGLRQELLLLAIAQKEGLEVGGADLEAYLESQATLVGAPAREYARFVRQDKDRMQSAQASALLEKTLNHLLAQAVIQEVEWPDAEDVEQVASATDEAEEE